MLVAPSFLAGHSMYVSYVCNYLYVLLRTASAVAGSQLKRRVQKKKSNFCARRENIGKVVHVHTIKAYERAQATLQTFLTFWHQSFTFKFLAHPVCKMWIIQEPKKVALWNKRHFEQKNAECAACLKYSVLIFVEKEYIKWHIWRVAVRPSYI